MTVEQGTIRFFVRESDARKYASENSGEFLNEKAIPKTLHNYELGKTNLIVATLRSASYGWRTCRDSKIEFSDDCPKDGPEIEQAKGRLRKW